MTEAKLPSRTEMASIKRAAREMQTYDRFRSYINGRCGRERRMQWESEGLLNEWFDQYRR